MNEVIEELAQDQNQAPSITRKEATSLAYNIIDRGGFLTDEEYLLLKDFDIMLKNMEYKLIKYSNLKYLCGTNKHTAATLANKRYPWIRAIHEKAAGNWEPDEEFFDAVLMLRLDFVRDYYEQLLFIMHDRWMLDLFYAAPLYKKPPEGEKVNPYSRHWNNWYGSYIESGCEESFGLDDLLSQSDLKAIVTLVHGVLKHTKDETLKQKYPPQDGYTERTRVTRTRAPIVQDICLEIISSSNKVSKEHEHILWNALKKKVSDDYMATKAEAAALVSDGSETEPQDEETWTIPLKARYLLSKSKGLDDANESKLEVIKGFEYLKDALKAQGGQSRTVVVLNDGKRGYISGFMESLETEYVTKKDLYVFKTSKSSVYLAKL